MISHLFARAHGSAASRAPSRLLAGGILGAALLLAAGCGTAQAPANAPITSAPGSRALGSSGVTSSPSAASGASSASAVSATTSTGASPGSNTSIPKTGLNPLLPLAGGALALLGAAAVVGGWRRMRGESR